MKRFLFLVSHLGSGWEEVYKSLDENPRIQMQHTGHSYDYFNNLNEITFVKHKLDTSAAIYGDVLLHNHSCNCKKIYEHCKFIYLIREAGPTLDELVNGGTYDAHYANRYYTFRLRRICEMAKKTPGAVLLTWDSMDHGLKLIEEYLSLKEELLLPSITTGTEVVGRETKRSAQESYERHLYFLKKLPLRAK